MEAIPAAVRSVVAAEQRCHFMHFYPSFCDIASGPVVVAAEEWGGAPASSTTADAAPAYQFIYDVMRSRGSQILFKQSYAARFLHSLTLAAPAHTFPADLQSTIQSRLQSYIDAPGVHLPGTTEQNVKLLSWLPQTAGPSGESATMPIPVLVMLVASSYPAESMYRDGARLGLLFDAHRVNPNAKVAQTGLRERAVAYQTEHHVYEVLLVHDAAHGYLVPEGSRSNYLLERPDGSWWCSAEEDILVGITLTTAYRVVPACAFGPVRHAKLSLRDILECRSLYMLGTSPTIMPVQSVLLYADAVTRQRYTDATRALGATAADSALRVCGDTAELLLPVNAEQAVALRTQYFAEASRS